MTVRSDGHRIPRPWILGSVAWVSLSLVVMLEYLNHGEPEHLTPIWFMLCLLWWQFCFAGIFAAVRRHQRHRLPGLLLLSLLPPLVLHLLVGLFV